MGLRFFLFTFQNLSHCFPFFRQFPTVPSTCTTSRIIFMDINFAGTMGYLIIDASSVGVEFCGSEILWL